MQKRGYGAATSSRHYVRSGQRNRAGVSGCTRGSGSLVSAGERLRGWDDAFERSVHRYAPTQKAQRRLALVGAAVVALVVGIAKSVAGDSPAWAIPVSVVPMVAAAALGLWAGGRIRQRKMERKSRSG
jgi:hypothetical protein